MFDVWMGDVELTTLVLVFSLVVLFPAQLLLCSRVKRRAVRLLPAAVLALVLLVLAGAAAATPGWDGLGFVVLALLAGIPLLACGAGWGVWALVRLAQRKSGRAEPPA